jgi:NADH-quinone oxidoreductase subunit F
MANLVPAVPRVAIGVGTCGRGTAAEGLYYAFAQAVEGSGDTLVHAPVGCFGACFQELLASVGLPGNPLVRLRKVQANDAVRLLHGEVSRSEFHNRPARLRLGIFSFL